MIAVRDEEGQALAIAAAGAFVLALALALTIDWGYALVQRRIAQNDADKVAIEVGRLLTTSVGLQNGTATFRVAGKNTTSVTKQKPLTHVEACSAAVSAYQRDRSTPATSPAIWLDFERWSGGSSSSEAPTSYVRANCAPGKSKTVSVDARTTTVRVRVEFRYRPIFASLLRQPAVVVGATSRVALAGAPYTVDPVDRVAVEQGSVSQDNYADLAQSASAIVRTWPLVRRFNLSSDVIDLSGKRPCGPPCDPATATPLTFYSGGRFASGVQVLNLSSQSAHSAGANQLITRAESGTLADWFANGFGGVLGLETEWSPPVGPAGPDAVPLLSDRRSSCLRVPGWLGQRPSCEPGGETRGDWVETISGPAVSDIVNGMRALIDSEGTTTAYSSKSIPGGGGPTYGKALVVWVYLWDCGQDFQSGEWESYSDSSDECRSDTDRVHLFSVIPVTFYQGLVTGSAIRGYWGGNFVEPGRCQAAPGSCPPLTPLANSAFLVADDQRWDPTDDGVSEDQDDEDECEGGGPGDTCDNGENGN